MVSQLSQNCWTRSQQLGSKITIKLYSRGLRSLRRCASLNPPHRVKEKSTDQLQMLPVVKSTAVTIQRKAGSVLHRNFRGRSHSIFSRDSTRAIRRAIPANT